MEEVLIYTRTCIITLRIIFYVWIICNAINRFNDILVSRNSMYCLFLTQVPSHLIVTI